MPAGPDHLLQPITSVAGSAFASLRQDQTVAEALQLVREKGQDWGERAVYFYVVDGEERLVGVLPTRRLLTADPSQELSRVMIAKVLSLPDSATVLDGCEAFVLHKLLAFPVLDGERRIVGVVDVALLADEAFDLAERDETNALFESIGVRIAQVRDAGPWRAFTFRFPWLLATIASGTVCAFLVGGFEATLAQSLILAFFLTLVLGLGESVAVQSMAVAIQSLRSVAPSIGWYARRLAREGATALLLGASCGLIVGLIAWFWRATAWEGFVIGGSIVLSLGMACFLGLSVPALLHSLKWDPKVAAGPLTLAVTDVCTLLFYFGLASMLL